MFFWILGIIAVFALGLAYGVFNSQKMRLHASKHTLREHLWNRSAKIPLLFSLTEPLKNTQGALFAEMLALRDVLCDEHIGLSDRLIKEKKMSDLIHDLFEKSKGSDGTVKDYSLITLLKDFNTLKDSINSDVREYNYQLDRFVSMLRFPWFSVWTLFAKKHENGGIGGV